MELHALNLPNEEVSRELFEQLFKDRLGTHYNEALTFLVTFSPVHAPALTNLLWFGVQKQCAERIIRRIKNWFDVYLGYRGTPTQLRADIETGDFLRGVFLNHFEGDTVVGLSFLPLTRPGSGHHHYDGFE